MTMDAVGNLTQRLEPNPAGGTFTTNYTCDLLKRLTLVSIPRGQRRRRAVKITMPRRSG